MNGQEYRNKINSRIDNPYTKILTNILSKMNNTQLNICASIATNYYSDIYHVGADKSMSVIAQTILEGNNPQTLIGLNYADMVEEYNNIKTSSIVNKLNEKDNIIKNINNIIKENNFGLSNSFFIQNNNINIEKMPIQGWKFHVSAFSLKDYENLCKIVIPEFNYLGIQFKVVRPEKFEEQLVSKQAGKAITVYFNDKFDINKFSDKLKHTLFQENSVKVNGDIHIDGRVYGRYGRFYPQKSKESFITDSYGKVFYDAKKTGDYAPDFIKSNSINKILSFNHDSFEKFIKTNDYKTYLQEKYTMTKCDSINHCYIAFKYNIQDENEIKSILNNNSVDKFSQSFIADTENGKYLMIHKSALDIIKEFSLNYIELHRPEWDIKTVDYIIPNSAANAIKENVKDNYGLEIFNTIDGTTIARCDTVFNQEYVETITNKLKIPMVLYDKNNEFKIQHNLNEIYDKKEFVPICNFNDIEH